MVVYVNMSLQMVKIVPRWGRCRIITPNSFSVIPSLVGPTNVNVEKKQERDYIIFLVITNEHILIRTQNTNVLDSSIYTMNIINSQPFFGKLSTFVLLK